MPDDILEIDAADGILTARGGLTSHWEMISAGKAIFRVLFDTYLLALQVNHFSGVFKKSENPTVTLWVNADQRRIPVRIKIKVFIGSVIFDLVSAN